jgi:hypothetical protein
MVPDGLLVTLGDGTIYEVMKPAWYELCRRWASWRRGMCIEVAIPRPGAQPVIVRVRAVPAKVRVSVPRRP